MRSHMMNLTVPLEPVSEETESTSTAISSSSSSEDENEQKGASYVLRENPKKSFRLADPEFFDAGSVSVVVQDRESETESSRNPTRRRSKRSRKSVAIFNPLVEDNTEKIGFQIPTKADSSSSISDVTTEDVAFCLMMLSRDHWRKNEKKVEEPDIDEYVEEDEEDDESDEKKSCKTGVRGKYKCETCNKVFRSYQALGGHRASHKKIKMSTLTRELESEREKVEIQTPLKQEKKIHKCPYCSRVFSSGQALGGHKRSHLTNGVVITAPSQPSTTTTTTSDRSSNKLGERLIDLNLPAPMEDDDFSQISDAEFLKSHNR